MRVTFSYAHIHLTINVTNVSLSRVYTSFYMLYLKNRNGYRHVLGTKMSTIPNFIFNFNIFMGLKMKAFWVIKEKTHFWADILDFGAAILEFWVARAFFLKSRPWRVSVPSFMLLYQTEVSFHQSAVLQGLYSSRLVKSIHTLECIPIRWQDFLAEN